MHHMPMILVRIFVYKSWNAKEYCMKATATPKYTPCIHP
jgi:hypothetical protein